MPTAAGPAAESPRADAESPRADADPRTPDGFAAMVPQLERVVGTVAMSFGIDRHDRADFVQDVLADLWAKRGQFDPARGVQFTTWAAGVAKNAAKKRHAVGKARAEYGGFHLSEFNDCGDLAEIADPSSVDRDDGDDDADPCDDQAGAVRDALAAGMLAALPPGYRELVRLVLSGLTIARVADQLGLKPSMTEVNLRHALKALRRKGLVPAELSARFDAVIGPEKPSPAGAAKGKNQRPGRRRPHPHHAEGDPDGRPVHDPVRAAHRRRRGA